MPLTRESGAPPIIEARRTAGGAITQQAADEFTYTVLLDTPSKSETDDRRLARRQRTRLRSGKVVDPKGRFVTECLVHDLSATGGRIRMPPGIALPNLIQFYDDQTGAVHEATVLWRRGQEAGIKFKAQADTPRSLKVAAEMRRKFYAVRD